MNTVFSTGESRTGQFLSLCVSFDSAPFLSRVETTWNITSSDCHVMDLPIKAYMVARFGVILEFSLLSAALLRSNPREVCNQTFPFELGDERLTGTTHPIAANGALRACDATSYLIFLSVSSASVCEHGFTPVPSLNRALILCFVPLLSLSAWDAGHMQPLANDRHICHAVVLWSARGAPVGPPPAGVSVDGQETSSGAPRRAVPCREGAADTTADIMKSGLVRFH